MDCKEWRFSIAEMSNGSDFNRKLMTFLKTIIDKRVTDHPCKLHIMKVAMDTSADILDRRTMALKVRSSFLGPPAPQVARLLYLLWRGSFVHCKSAYAVDPAHRVEGAMVQ
jgi:hypothetical protein